MDIDQTPEVLGATSEKSTVAAIHLETMDHCGVTRDELREAADEKDISPSRLIKPDNGEKITF